MTQLSPELRTRLVAHVGADTSASDDAVLVAFADEFDAQRAELLDSVEVLKKIPPLSADVDRLTGELEAAQELANSKTQEVLALSANVPGKPDPLVVGMYAETLDARAEAAIEAGVPKAAVDYFANLFKLPDGTPTVLALSACSVPAADNKTKNTRLGIAIIDGLAKLAKGGFGQGGPVTGAAPGKVGVITMSASGEQTGKLSMTEYSESRSLHGMATTPADYQAYLAR